MFPSFHGFHPMSFDCVPRINLVALLRTYFALSGYQLRMTQTRTAQLCNSGWDRAKAEAQQAEFDQMMNSMQNYAAGTASPSQPR